MIAFRAITLTWASIAMAAPDHPWIKAGSMCVGIMENCNSVATCTYHAYGPCGGNKTAPDIYLEGSLVGFALIKNASTYLTDATAMTVVDPSEVANNGYRHAAEDKTCGENGDCKYALVTAGGYYGTDPVVSGGFLGMASYAMISGSVKTKYVDVLVPDSPGQDDSVDKITEKTVCITEVASDGACSGADRTFTAGDFKFSLFGYTTGSSFSPGDGTKYYGIRTKMTLVGTAGTVTLNDGVALDAIGSTDVKKLKLQETAGDQRTLEMDFPLHYNEGSTTAALVDGKIPAVATKEVKIKVSKAETADSIYIDYLFDVAYLSVANRYFVYDPTVTETTAAAGTTAAPAGSAGTTVSGAFKMSMSLPLVVALVASLMRAAA
jgi:hypothetical protein